MPAAVGEVDDGLAQAVIAAAAECDVVGPSRRAGGGREAGGGGEGLIESPRSCTGNLRWRGIAPRHLRGTGRQATTSRTPT